MSLSPPHHLLYHPPSRITSFFTTRNFLRNPNFSSPITSRRLAIPSHFQILHRRPHEFRHLYSFKVQTPPIQVYNSEGSVQRDNGVNNFNFDCLLSISEAFCLFSAAIVSIGYAVNFASSGRKMFTGVIGERVLVMGVVMLVGGVVLGGWIRRRQWRRICTDSVKVGGESFNLVARIEKLEEDLRSSATIIRVLSRHLEKLGIRFRVTRKALKEPIIETAALAQKNSEATRALAVQEDILEKELGEIQKVLLAMQDQQQKQLELIIAIAKTGKLWESRRGPAQDQDTVETLRQERVKHVEASQTEASA